MRKKIELLRLIHQISMKKKFIIGKAGGKSTLLDLNYHMEEKS